MRCPDDDTIIDLLEGRLGDADRGELLRHLDGCDACRHLVADAGALADDGEDGDEAAAYLGRGATIGRYVVARVLGVGAMGVVYAAHDPQLGRDVAIKLLRRDALGGDATEAARGLMLREARTLAQLTHPNVIAVHDADVHDGRVFIVMELVDGCTLRAWRAQAPRAWPALRDVFVQAGRGLAAAHVAGLVHRDVKPDNVLVGRDGRVRVTDFGLARWSAPWSRPSPAQIADAGLRSSTALVGTPAYMAPEQLAGQPIDARADVFGFCVALYEALYGARPFDGRRPEDALPPVIAAPRPGLPARARRALERGLRADRSQRPPSMTALLAEIDHRPRVTAPRVALGAVALAALGAAGVALRPTAPATAPCSGGAAAWGALWDDAQRAAVRATFTRTGQTIAADAFAQTDAGVIAYRRRWIDLHGDACRANRRGEQSAAVLDRRMACLDRRHREAADIIASVAANVATQDWLLAEAAGMIRRLSPLDDCATARDDAQASLQIRPVHAPVARLDHDGRLEVFVIGAGGQPWRIAELTGGATPTWGSWTPLGTGIDARRLRAFGELDGRLGLIAIDAAGAVEGITQAVTGWDDARWRRIGGDGTEQVELAADGGGRHQLFALGRGAVTHLGQTAANSGWGHWTPVQDHGAQQVVAINDEGANGGRVHTFTLVAQRAWHAWQAPDGTWTAPQPLGDQALRQIDAAVDAGGRLEVVGVDAGGRAFHARATSATAATWSAWEPLGTADQIATIHVVRNRYGDAHLEAVGVTPTGQIIHLWQAGRPLAWNGWWEDLPLDPTMKAVEDLTLALDGGGRLWVFAATASGALWMLWQTWPGAGPWHGWLVL